MKNTFIALLLLVLAPISADAFFSTTASENENAPKQSSPITSRTSYIDTVNAWAKDISTKQQLFSNAYKVNLIPKCGAISFDTSDFKNISNVVMAQTADSVFESYQRRYDSWNTCVRQAMSEVLSTIGGAVVSETSQPKKTSPQVSVQIDNATLLNRILVLEKKVAELERLLAR